MAYWFQEIKSGSGTGGSWPQLSTMMFWNRTQNWCQILLTPCWYVNNSIVAVSEGGVQKKSSLKLYLNCMCLLGSLFSFFKSSVRYIISVLSHRWQDKWDKWETYADTNKPLELFKQVSLMTLDTILKCAFSYNSNCQTKRWDPFVCPCSCANESFLHCEV